MTRATGCAKRSLSQLTITFALRKPLCVEQSRNWHVAAQRSRQPGRKQKQKQDVSPLKKLIARPKLKRCFEPRRKSSDWPHWKLFSQKPKPKQGNEAKKKSNFVAASKDCIELKKPTLSVLRRQKFACWSRK